jgi:hypothetical protein
MAGLLRTATWGSTGGRIGSSQCLAPSRVASAVGRVSWHKVERPQSQKGGRECIKPSANCQSCVYIDRGGLLFTLLRTSLASQ